MKSAVDYRRILSLLRPLAWIAVLGLGLSGFAHADDPIIHADAYLAALQATPGAITAITDLTGEVLPPSGPPTNPQLQWLISQLYNSDGSPTLAYTNPTAAAAGWAPAETYLQTLRQTNGALAALQDLTGQSLPPSGILTTPQIQFLFTQLFDANGNPTLAYSNPTLAISYMQASDFFLGVLRGVNGALQSLQNLTGEVLPAGGALTGDQIGELVGLMFHPDGSPQQFLTDYLNGDQGAFNAPAHNLVYADDYLMALRNTTGALQALSDLTGAVLPSSGTLSGTQMDQLTGLLYTSSGGYQGFVTSGTYSTAAQNLVYGDDYLMALRNTPGALQALASLTGLGMLPSSGTLNGSQMDELIGLLYTSSGAYQTFVTSGTFSSAANDIELAYLYLTALRNAHALDALANLTGLPRLPDSGPLTNPQLQELIGLLYQSDGNYQPFVQEYIDSCNEGACDPSIFDKAAQSLNYGELYLEALRGTPGALDALANLTGLPRLPDSGPLVINGDSTDLNELLGLLYQANGDFQTFVQAYINSCNAGSCNAGIFNQAAQNLIYAEPFLSSLRNTPAALQALANLTGLPPLPPSGPLTGPQLDELIGLLYTSNGTLQTFVQAYINSCKTGSCDQEIFDQAAQNLIYAEPFLASLRNTPGALQALANLTGLPPLPASGPLTGPQLDELISLLYTSNGTLQPFVQDYINSCKAGSCDPGIFDQAAENLVLADAYLVSLRKTPGALTALMDLTGIVLPPNGVLTGAQLDDLIGLLYTKDGSLQTFVQDYINSCKAGSCDQGIFDHAAQNLVYAGEFLAALRKNPASLQALADLTGKALLPSSGKLSGDQLDELIGLLYTKNKTLQSFVVNGQFDQAAQNLIYADEYLTALRKNNSLAALNDLTGKSFPQSGGLSGDQIDTLIGLLYKSDGTLQKFVTDGKFDQAAIDLIHADNYLQALRGTPGALEELQKISGILLPQSGPLTNVAPDYEIDFLFSLLFEKDGVTHTQAYNDPWGAARALANLESTSQSNKNFLMFGLLAALGVMAFFLFKDFSWMLMGAAGGLLALVLFLMMHGTPSNQSVAQGDLPSTDQFAQAVKAGAQSANTAGSSSTASNAVVAQSPFGSSSAAVSNLLANNTMSSSSSGTPASSGSSAATSTGATGAALSQQTINGSPASQNTAEILKYGASSQTSSTFDPAHSYVPFYIATGQGATGLSANSQAVAALQTQSADLSTAMSIKTKADDAMLALQRAGASDKLVTSIKTK